VKLDCFYSYAFYLTLIIEYTRYKIANERRKDFENVYAKAEHSLKASSHCLHYELSDCVEKPEYYVLRVEWDLTGFRESSEFQTFFEAVRPLMIFNR
jgi:quinol monooxygenase YgiN